MSFERANFFFTKGPSTDTGKEITRTNGNVSGFFVFCFVLFCFFCLLVNVNNLSKRVNYCALIHIRGSPNYQFLFVIHVCIFKSIKEKSDYGGSPSDVRGIQYNVFLRESTGNVNSTYNLQYSQSTRIITLIEPNSCHLSSFY